MATRRKVNTTKKVVEESPTEETASTSERITSIKKTGKRICFFCESKKNPSYTDTQTLRKFFSDRARIIPKQRSGACSKHQRALAKEIKYARHLSLLPFTPRI